MNDARPVGVFDSGVGGLSVLAEIARELPAEQLVYVADSAHLPYGDKPADYVRTRARACTAFLLARGCKAVVVACNTATAAAIEALRACTDAPVIGMEPPVKPAVEATRSGVIGVLLTSGTAASARYAQLVERYGSGISVITQPCPGLVQCVEEGDLASTRAHALLETYVTPLLARGVDALILGCTHYPFLRPALERVIPQDVRVLDAGAAVARQLRRRLADAGLLAAQGGPPEFWTSGDPLRFVRARARLYPSTSGAASVETAGEFTRA